MAPLDAIMLCVPSTSTIRAPRSTATCSVCVIGHERATVQCLRLSITHTGESFYIRGRTSYSDEHKIYRISWQVALASAEQTRSMLRVSMTLRSCSYPTRSTSHNVQTQRPLPAGCPRLQSPTPSRHHPTTFCCQYRVGGLHRR